jgi:large subunit ribosomal protein L6
MSRIGKLPIAIPAGVTITVDPDDITVKGPKGELKQFILPEVDVKQEGDQIVVTRHSDEKLAKSQHGLMRALLNNMVVGVTEGFEKKLEINGVGFRLASKGPQEIEMSLGFSHPVTYKAPDGVTLAVNKMEITVTGISKQQVGQTAAEIRALKKP